jgi:hypothetical protein
MPTATMTVAEMFSTFVDNLAVEKAEEISARYGEITRALNKCYRETESTTANSLYVGSYGRGTGINGISDLDMIYMLPKEAWDRYKDDRQSVLLQDAKKAIKERYPRTEMRGDGQVVVVEFDSQSFEVVPAFEQDDGSFKYPDTNNGGSWPITKPRAEIKAIRDADEAKNKNLRNLCQMARAWKNQHGVEMGGLLIDTLAYNFLQSTSSYDDKSRLYYDFMVRDFFLYLSEEEDQEYYLAPGSNQRVYVERRFQKKAKKAHKLCLEAIEAEKQPGVNKKWKRVFGRPFPAAVVAAIEAAAEDSGLSWTNTEEFIEDKHPVDIRHYLKIDCEVSDHTGISTRSLREMLEKGHPLYANRGLRFHVTRDIDVPEPYHLEWKVLNQGPIARRKNQVRGQIVRDHGHNERTETANFKGDHIVECYAIRNRVVVAKDRIHVPIANGE